MTSNVRKTLRRTLALERMLALYQELSAAAILADKKRHMG